MKARVKILIIFTSLPVTKIKPMRPIIIEAIVPRMTAACCGLLDMVGLV